MTCKGESLNIFLCKLTNDSSYLNLFDHSAFQVISLTRKKSLSGMLKCWIYVGGIYTLQCWGPGNCVVHSACVRSKEVLSYSAYFYSFLLNAFLQLVR